MRTLQQHHYFHSSWPLATSQLHATVFPAGLPILVKDLTAVKGLLYTQVSLQHSTPGLTGLQR